MYRRRSGLWGEMPFYKPAFFSLVYLISFSKIEICPKGNTQFSKWEAWKEYQIKLTF